MIWTRTILKLFWKVFRSHCGLIGTKMAWERLKRLKSFSNPFTLDSFPTITVSFTVNFVGTFSRVLFFVWKKVETREFITFVVGWNLPTNITVTRKLKNGTESTVRYSPPRNGLVSYLQYAHASTTYRYYFAERTIFIAQILADFT